VRRDTHILDKRYRAKRCPYGRSDQRTKRNKEIKMVKRPKFEIHEKDQTTAERLRNINHAGYTAGYHDVPSVTSYRTAPLATYHVIGTHIT